MYGMSFIDMAFLTLDKLKGGRVTYRRKKTSKIYDFVISEQLKEVLEFYIKRKKQSDFVFSIINSTEFEKQYIAMHKNPAHR